MNLKRQYDKIYDEMIERNEKNISEGNVKYDSVLQSLDIDQRQGLAIFAFFDSSVNKLNENFNNLYEAARDKFPSHVIYHPERKTTATSGVLHHTLLQITPTAELDDEFLQNTENYIEILADELYDLGPFTIDYQGTIAISTGILLYAYPNKDLNECREKIREKINKKNLPFNEPYVSDIVHSTFVRLTESIEPSKLIDFSRRHRNDNLGELKVHEMYLGKGSWRMWEEETEMFYKLDLENKKTIGLFK